MADASPAPAAAATGTALQQASKEQLLKLLKKQQLKYKDQHGKLMQMKATCEKLLSQGKKYQQRVKELEAEKSARGEGGGDEAKKKEKEGGAGETQLLVQLRRRLKEEAEATLILRREAAADLDVVLRQKEMAEEGRAEAERQLQSAERDRARAVGEQRKAEEGRAEAEGRNEECERLLAAADEEREALKKQLQEVVVEKEGLEGERGRYKGLAEAAEAQLDSVKQALGEAQSKMKQAEEATAKAEAEAVPSGKPPVKPSPAGVASAPSTQGGGKKKNRKRNKNRGGGGGGGGGGMGDSRAVSPMLGNEAGAAGEEKEELGKCRERVSALEAEVVELKAAVVMTEEAANKAAAMTTHALDAAQRAGEAERAALLKVKQLQQQQQQQQPGEEEERLGAEERASLERALAATEAELEAVRNAQAGVQAEAAGAAAAMEKLEAEVAAAKQAVEEEVEKAGQLRAALAVSEAGKAEAEAGLAALHLKSAEDMQDAEESAAKAELRDLVKANDGRLAATSQRLAELEESSSKQLCSLNKHKEAVRLLKDKLQKLASDLKEARAQRREAAAKCQLLETKQLESAHTLTQRLKALTQLTAAALALQPPPPPEAAVAAAAAAAAAPSMEADEAGRCAVALRRLQALGEAVNEDLAALPGLKQREGTARARIEELERELRASDGRSAELEDKGREVRKLLEDKKMLEAKMTKMKGMLLRVNKHMTSTKGLIPSYKAQLALLRSHLNSRWLHVGAKAPHPTTKAAANNKSQRAAEAAKGEGNEEGEEDPVLGAGVDPMACRVVARVADEDGLLWVLVDAKLSLASTHSSQASAPDNLGGQHIARRPNRFWCLQDTLLSKRATSTTATPQGATAALAADEELLTAARAAAASAGEAACTLPDGLMLPATLQQRWAARSGEDLAVRLKAASSTLQDDVARLTGQLDVVRRERDEAEESHTRYKARAHGVLKQQASQIQQHNALTALHAQLTAEHEQLQARAARLAEEAQRGDAAALQEALHGLEACKYEGQELRDQLSAQARRLQEEAEAGRAQLVEAERAWQASMAEKAAAWEAEKGALVADFAKRRAKAAEYLQQRDSKIAALQHKLRTSPPAAAAAAAAHPSKGHRVGNINDDNNDNQSAPAPTAAAAAAAVVLGPQDGEGSGGGAETEAGDEGGDGGEGDGAVDAVGQARIRKLQELLRAKEIAQAHHREKEVEFQLRLSELERQRGRDQQLSENMEYLKNVVVGYMEDSANHEKLFPVIATLLQLSPEETQQVQDRREQSQGFLGKWL